MLNQDDRQAIAGKTPGKPARPWRGCGSAATVRYLFDINESLLPVFGWLTATSFSLLALLTGVAFWLPLGAGLVFGYWAWLSIQRVRIHLLVYPDRLEVSSSEFLLPGGPDPEPCHLQVPMADITDIDLRGPGLEIKRTGDRPPVVVLEGLSSKKRHQFHHLFDLQQRQGSIPATIAVFAPQIASTSELGRLVFAAIMVLWLLHTLAL